MKKSLFSLLLVSLFAQSIYANDREEALCGTFFEPLVFWMWSSMTPKPDSSIVANIPFIEPSQYVTSDGKTLRGHRYLSNNGYAKTSPKGYILVAMGNTMLSDQMVVMLKSFSQRGYDVYVYDYRGYANSEGSRRIKAIIEDYKEIAQTLNKIYKKKLLYGISLGGAVMLNIIGSGLEYDAAVIDSAPSSLSPFGCPKSIDPLENLPKDAGKIFVITAQSDSVLPSSMTSPLRESAKERGAKTLDGEEYEHPFADINLKVHYQRMALILEFLDTKN